MKQETTRALIGLILAGGHSKRMGTDKSALVHPDGRTLARRSYDLLLEAGADSVMVSLRHDQALPAGLDGITDLKIARDPKGESQGPLSGLLAAIRLQPNADWLVVACDLPRLDLQTLQHLIRSKLPEEPFLAYRSEFDGLPEPLCTIYGEGSLTLLEQAVAKDMRCPRKALIQQQCRLLDPISPRALDNANTPSDWQEATLKP